MTPKRTLIAAAVLISAALGVPATAALAARGDRPARPAPSPDTSAVPEVSEIAHRVTRWVPDGALPPPGPLPGRGSVLHLEGGAEDPRGGSPRLR
jgi:hypothetical protein